MEKLEVNCGTCNKSVYIYPCQIKETNFCSKTCWYSYKDKGKSVERICDFCGGAFSIRLRTVVGGRGRYCSYSCASKSRLKKRWGVGHTEFIRCLYCGKNFKASICEKRKFCSHECYSKNKEGNVLSEEARKNISDALKGKKPKNFGNGFGGSGSCHNNWKGGISKLPYCDKWTEELKEAVRNRDNRTCQLCNKTEIRSKLSVHHIHYDKENCYPDLIALCRSCNCKVNVNRDFYEELFTFMLWIRGILYWKPF